MLRPHSIKFSNQIKSLIRPIIRLHPRGENIVKHLLFNLWRHKIRLVSYTKQFDANNTYWLNPHYIHYALTDPDPNIASNIGKITSGNWDLNITPFTELDVYEACKSHFMENKDWEDTDFYKRVVHEISVGATKWNCTSKSEFDVRLKKLNILYEDIRDNGYKPQEEVFRLVSPQLKALESIDEVAVRIGRHGDVLLEDGRHRLAISKLLNLPNIPVKITVRHSEWYTFRKEILHFAKRQRNKVYHPLTHIDLRDIPTEHGHSRFEIIKTYFPKEKGTMLDLGAHWGYFCHKCEEEGFNCLAIENDIRNLYFLRGLKRAENRQFEVIEGSILNYKSKTNFSIVLALNIFHHFLKYEHTYHKLIDFLRRMNMEIMIFETHLPDEQQMVGAYKNYGCEEFAEFILKHSKLNHYKLIGKAEDKRPIYMLYK
jgi:hypothetical protein